MCDQLQRVERRRYDPQARPSTSFVDNTIELPWRNFPSQMSGGFFLGGGQMSVYRDCMLTVCLDSRRRRDAQAEGERGRDVNEASWAFFPLYSALVRSM